MDDDNADKQESVTQIGLSDNQFDVLLDESMHMLFSGYFNGYGIEVRSAEEISLLYRIGCFGKGSSSRSKPVSLNDTHQILRQRQYLRRNLWYKKYQNNNNAEAKRFLEEVIKLTKTMNSENKNVIDLVSSDESDGDERMEESLGCVDKPEVVIVVPNSDSEGEDYFENLKPKCCANNVKLNEKLILNMQEAYFLAYELNCLQIYNYENEILNLEQSWNLFSNVDKNFVQKYVVYHYYRSKGYIVKSGIKFGGDYLLYKNKPSIVHADFIIVIKYDNEKYKMDWISILGHVRMAATTVKEIILVEVIKDSNSSETKPHHLSNYSVQEVLLKRNIPIEIKEDNN